MTDRLRDGRDPLRAPDAPGAPEAREDTLKNTPTNTPEAASDALSAVYDVVVAGGGAAGLSGALMLARARRSVVVVDAGAPRNAPAAGVHGLLAREGMAPAELVARGRAEVRRYGGQVVTGEIAEVTTAGNRAEGSGEPGGPGVRARPRFTVTLADGRRVGARRLLVATGLADELPDVPGLWDRWGHDVIHCPYCHGWEARDKAIGVLASGPMSVHQALLIRQWSDDVTYFTHTSAPPTAEEAEQLAARGVRVVPGEVTGLVTGPAETGPPQAGGSGGAEESGAAGRGELSDVLTGVRLRDGGVVAREVLAVAPRMVARAGFLAPLGLRAAPHPAGVGEHVPCDATGRTEVPGVWVAGNATDLSAQVGAAAAAGASAGAQINADLVAEETRAAVEALRASAAPAAAGARSGS